MKLPRVAFQYASLLTSRCVSFEDHIQNCSEKQWKLEDGRSYQSNLTMIFDHSRIKYLSANTEQPQLYFSISAKNNGECSKPHDYRMVITTLCTLIPIGKVKSNAQYRAFCMGHIKVYKGEKRIIWAQNLIYNLKGGQGGGQACISLLYENKMRPYT